MKLSIVTASRNETSMLVVTVISAVEALRASGVSGEVFVVDNSDAAVYPAVEACLHGQLKGGNVRMVHEAGASIARATDRAHREALGELVIYMDAHCILGHDTIPALIDFDRRHTDDPIGFVHAPIQWAHRSDNTRQTHFCVDRTALGEWSGGGCVSHEKRTTWKGMPHMIRRSAWESIGGLGCLAEHGCGWGILRYIGMKPWFHGLENWAIPDGTVYHLGEWPEIAQPHTRYRHYQSSGNNTGAAIAVAAYIYGGEDLLRQEYELSKLQRFFATADEAVKIAIQIGGKEREELLSRGTGGLQELIARAPWNR